MIGSEEGCAALLAGLPGMGPKRLSDLLAAWGPTDAWAHIRSGRARELGADLEALAAGWDRARVDADPAREAMRHAALGVAVLLRGGPGYPVALSGDIEAPAVLFAQGEVSTIEGPRVAIVGTRRCTGTGAGFARQLGRELAEAGVVVVSGLALGIDGASHRGVLDGAGPSWAGPVGVIGSGHDVVYPRRHGGLWRSVGERGVLLGEAPLGAPPAAWRFPARNRIIAALADLVVVVESHAAGGSMLTVSEAIDRGTQVMAVPGSIRNPASAGTNQLLAEGCHPARDTDDVLMALGLVPGGRRVSPDRRRAPDAVALSVLDAFDWEPATLEHLVLRTGLPIGQLSLSVHQLLEAGWIRSDGSFYERL